MPSRPRKISVGLLLVLVLGVCSAQADLALLDAWIQEAPPGSRVLAGYLTLENSGNEDRALVEVASPQFGRVEMHRTVIVDDVARMEAQPRLEVPAGGRLEMLPGGYHLMLFEPVTPLESGMQVEVILEFDDQSALSHAADVRSHREAGAHGHHHHHH